MQIYYKEVMLFLLWGAFLSSKIMHSDSEHKLTSLSPQSWHIMMQSMCLQPHGNRRRSQLKDALKMHSFYLTLWQPSDKNRSKRNPDLECQLGERQSPIQHHKLLWVPVTIALASSHFAWWCSGQATDDEGTTLNLESYQGVL